MKRSSALAVLFASVVAACGGGGGGAPAPAPGVPAPVPAPPPPPPPAPAPPAPGLAGTWTAPLSTCINPDVSVHLELGPNSLGHIPCLTGTYYATVIQENFFDTGPRIGKTCDLSIAANATYTVEVDGVLVATFLKTVFGTINGVEQSGSFVYGFWPNGTTPVITTTQFYDGGSAQVTVNPTQFGTPISLPFTKSGSKLRIEANYKPAGSANSTYLVCEG